MDRTSFEQITTEGVSLYLRDGSVAEGIYCKPDNRSSFSHVEGES